MMMMTMTTTMTTMMTMTTTPQRRALGGHRSPATAPPTPSSSRRCLPRRLGLGLGSQPRLVCLAMSSSRIEKQLGTAKLPEGLNTDQFLMQMFQWANTISTSGQNLPLALPLKVDRTAKGFTMSLIRIDSLNSPVSVGDIIAEIVDVEAGRQAFVIRLEQKKSEILVDLDLIMASMKMAIVRAIRVTQASSQEE